MDDVLKSDVFFFVATIGFTLLATGFGIALYFIIRIVRDIAHIAREAKMTFETFRERLEEQPFIGKFFAEKPPRKARVRTKKKQSDTL